MHMKIQALTSRILVWLLLSGLAIAQTGEGPLNPDPPQGITPQQIVEKFAAKETEFNQARAGYTWRQTIKVQTLDGDTVNGEYQLTTDELFDDKGRRVQKVVYAPPSTLE